ncbi:transcription elongation factor GreAB [Pelagibius litoralis]|uniref:Transcription elongation factor GreAB n=1 Tax=Pelagibius litoralis TaxID=374515 RepID=A0A967F2X6_9PROT|nr:GreA/GreB family elongation factor [Pelagibius litoralis]NIA71916.1 transcription elongation factor GreAB [Pelagibius litoralis]
MSRAFVKEDDSGAPEAQVDLPVSTHPNLVTPRGLQMLNDKVAEYDAERAGLKAHDDELAAQSHLPRVEQELRYWEERLRSAIPVDLSKQPRDVVAFGAVVTVADEAGEKHDYAIVGEDEADPQAGKVSYVSPLARALDGAAVGDVILWKRPAGDQELEVVAIGYER